MLSAGENNCSFKQATTVGNLGWIAAVKGLFIIMVRVMLLTAEVSGDLSSNKVYNVCFLSDP